MLSIIYLWESTGKVKKLWSEFIFLSYLNGLIDYSYLLCVLNL